mmetsp:Transcript_5556/g.16207  ORF Transcript_5556/g.16207 Transcript_5556/m.16207 type:complete len:81 (+) Transcript_5556:1270-1512(+)
MITDLRVFHYCSLCYVLWFVLLPLNCKCEVFLIKCLINKTRFYTRTRIKQTDEITSVDDVKEKKKPQECRSTTNKQAGKE